MSVATEVALIRKRTLAQHAQQSSGDSYLTQYADSANKFCQPATPSTQIKPPTCTALTSLHSAVLASPTVRASLYDMLKAELPMLNHIMAMR